MHQSINPDETTTPINTTVPPSDSTKPVNFVSMDPERHRQISSQGGKALKNSQRSFSKSRELAVAAGKKGGISVAPENRSFSRNPELAREAGRKGGQARHKRMG